MSPVLNALKSPKGKAVGAVIAAGASVVLIRNFVYRPAQKQDDKDLLVPVERSGGGI